MKTMTLNPGSRLTLSTLGIRLIRIVCLIDEENNEKKRMALETIVIIKAGKNGLHILNDIIPASPLANAVYDLSLIHISEPTRPY